MKLILITSPKSIHSRYQLSSKKVICLFTALLMLPTVLGFSIYYAANSFGNAQLNATIANNWDNALNENAASLNQLRESSNTKLKALTLALADAQARLIRLEALGEKLVSKGKLNRGEFVFSDAVALGGMHDQLEDEAFAKPGFMSEIDKLLYRIESQQLQMNVLDSLLEDRLINKEVFLAGRPIKKGWMSSRFGPRIDPFSGKLAQHNGVDFAGEEDSEIIAVASGVVTWSEERDGYGLLVEIDHGEGFKTRYAHNKANLVKAGDLVQRGQALALMGSTGRSTGPHTHFEVLKNDRHVDPERYVNRVVRQ